MGSKLIAVVENTFIKSVSIKDTFKDTFFKSLLSKFEVTAAWLVFNPFKKTSHSTLDAPPLLVSLFAIPLAVSVALLLALPSAHAAQSPDSSNTGALGLPKKNSTLLNHEILVRFRAPQNTKKQAYDSALSAVKEGVARQQSDSRFQPTGNFTFTDTTAGLDTLRSIQKLDLVSAPEGVVKLKFRTEGELEAARLLLESSSTVEQVSNNRWYRPAIHYSSRPADSDAAAVRQRLWSGPTTGIPAFDSFFIPFNPASVPDVLLPPAQILPGADPLVASDWAMTKIGFKPNFSADYLNLNQNIITAVIDTGVDYNHEDLVQAMWRAPWDSKEVGFDFAHNLNRPYDQVKFDMEGCLKDPDCMSGEKQMDYLANPGHGTHCAGHVAAVYNNSLGIKGVAAGAKIIGLKFFYDAGEENAGAGDDTAAIQSIEYAIKNGAKVISASWGGRGPRDEAEKSELKKVLIQARDAGVLFVVAAGNDGINQDTDRYPDFPAGFTDLDNLIVVAATDSKDKLASFSNYGAKSVHLGAPGVKILSTTVGSKYSDKVVEYIDASGKKRQIDWDGTSMATPIVAGAAALVWSVYPSESYLQIRERILKSVRPVALLKSKLTTGGVLDVDAALRYTAPPIAPEGDSAAVPAPGVVPSPQPNPIPGPVAVPSTEPTLPGPVRL